MEEPYTEGLASHGGPESCVGRREAAGEALTGVRIGWVWSHEIHSLGANAVCRCGRQHGRSRNRERSFDLAWS